MSNEIEFTRTDVERLVSIESETKAQSKTLAEIKELLVKQNGRVSKLEGWQKYIKGGLGVIAFAITILFMK